VASVSVCVCVCVQWIQFPRRAADICLHQNVEPISGPSQPHAQGAPGALSVKLSTDRPLLSRSRMSGAVTPRRHIAVRCAHWQHYRYTAQALIMQCVWLLCVIVRW